jgi:hypothetical protein
MVMVNFTYFPEQYYLLGGYIVYFGRNLLTFWRNVPLPSAGLKNEFLTDNTAAHPRQ